MTPRLVLDEFDVDFAAFAARLVVVVIVVLGRCCGTGTRTLDSTRVSNIAGARDLWHAGADETATGAAATAAELVFERAGGQIAGVAQLRHAEGRLELTGARELRAC